MKHKNINLLGLKRLAKNVAKSELKKYRKVGLIGQLGSGKTTFVKHLAQALNIKFVKSPTFTVVNCYKTSPYSFYHIDLYRLEKPSELIVLGLDEIWSDPQAIVLVEWVDKFPKLKKQCDLLINFEISKNNTRNVTVQHN